MRSWNIYIIILFGFLALACKNEGDLLPSKLSASSILLISQGDSDEPVSIDILANGDYFILSNTRFFFNEISFKVRAIRIRPSGEVVYDHYYPQSNDLSWKANKAFVLEDNTIIIGANSDQDGAMLLKLNDEGDSIQAQLGLSPGNRFLDGSLQNNKIISMNSGLSGVDTEVLIEQIDPNSLSLLQSSSKSFVVDTIPAQSLLVKGDTIAFPSRKVINYGLRSSGDLDDDASLSSLDLKIKRLSIGDDNSSICFGELSQGTASKIFTSTTRPGASSKKQGVSILGNPLASIDVLNQIKEEEGFILLCGSRSPIGNNVNSEYLIMKVNKGGGLIWESVFEGDEENSNRQNAFFDATFDGNNIIAIGTTNFNGSQTLVLKVLDDRGKIIRL